MIPVFGGKAGMVQDQAGTGALRLQFESDDGIDAGRPLTDPPSLDDPLIGDQLNVSRCHSAAEKVANPAFYRMDLSWISSKRGELLGIEERFVDALRAGL